MLEKRREEKRRGYAKFEIVRENFESGGEKK